MSSLLENLQTRNPDLAIHSVNDKSFRRFGRVTSYHLKKMGVVMKKARYFITCRELPFRTIQELSPAFVRHQLTRTKKTDERQLILTFED